MQRELRLIGGSKNEGKGSSLNETRIGTTNGRQARGMEMLLYDRMMKLKCIAKEKREFDFFIGLVQPCHVKTKVSRQAAASTQNIEHLSQLGKGPTFERLTIS